MATPTIKTKLQLDGEKEYKQAISDINSGIKVLNSEMKLASEQFKDNASSVDALTKKNDILDRQILSQKDKIEKLKAALQNSAEKFGEADKRTDSWKVSLNNAERELIGMEREAKDVKEALKGYSGAVKDADGKTEALGRKGKGLGEVIDGLGGKFGVSLPENVRKSLDGLVTVNSKFIAIAGAAAAAAAAIAKVEEKLIAVTKEQAAAADEIITASYVTGMSTEAIQEYRYAAELLDVSFETLQSSQTKLIRVMYDAQQGSATAQDAFNKLGISIYDTDGNLRNATDVFDDAIDALGDMQNETERDALAMEIFGRSARDLNPLIVQGSRVLEEYRKEAHDTGYVLDDEMLGALGDVDDAIQRYNNSQTVAKNFMALEFAPALTEFYNTAGEGIRDFGKMAKDSGLVEIFASILELVTALAPAFEVLGDVLAACAPVFKIVAVAISIIADALRVAGDVAGVIISALFGGLGTGTTQKYIDDLGDYFSGNNATNRAWSNAWNASGDTNWRGGMTWVGENGPERVYLPQGSQIMSASESRRSAGGDVFNITIDAHSVKEFNDIVRIAQNQRRISRMEA